METGYKYVIRYFQIKLLVRSDIMKETSYAVSFNGIISHEAPIGGVWILFNTHRTVHIPSASLKHSNSLTWSISSMFKIAQR